MTNKRILTGLAVVAGLAMAATGVSVAQDAIAARKAMMKGAGGVMKVLVPMVKGEAPFDAAKTKAELAKLEKAGAEFPKLFPAGSDKGDTNALPAVWTGTADFTKKAGDMAAAAKAAAAAADKGADAFKAAFGAVGKSCGACHETYRKKQ